MIRKTIQAYNRFAPDRLDGIGGAHIEKVIRTTWWLLFIPIYSSEQLIGTNL